MRIALVVTIALGCALVRPGLSQQPPAPQVGLDARITPTCSVAGAQANTRCAVFYGKLWSLSADSVSIRDYERGTQRLAWSHVQALSVSRRSTGHAGTGVLVGAAVGALVLSGCKDGGDDPGLCRALRVVTISGGALLGALLGALSRTQVWEPAAIPGR